MKLEKPQKKLLYRVLMFLGLFVVVSGIIGSWLVPTRLLMTFGFYIYGNFGKMVIVSVLIFAFIAKDRLSDINLYPWSKSNLLYLILVPFLTISFFVMAGVLLRTVSPQANWPLTIFAHLNLIALPLLILFGVFGPKTVFEFSKKFLKELLVCAAISAVLVVGIFHVWNLWPYFSWGVLSSVKFLLSLTFDKVRHILPLTLVVEDFAVTVAKACSGLDSLFMFSSLLALIGLIDYKKIHLPKFLIIFSIGAIGMYLINILRVYLLIVIGVTISPELALQLFHTYAGMILFVIYFAFFLKIAYKKFLKINQPQWQNPAEIQQVNV